jgi:Ca2+-binding RTX toxin-like protein
MAEVLVGDSHGAARQEARAIVAAQRPAPGATLLVPSEAGQLIILEFNPAGAGFALEGEDFVLILEDGGRVVFQGLVSAAQGEDAPTVQIAGIDIGADHLVDQARTLAGAEEPVETAAGEGEGAETGGGSQYGDTFGDLIAGLIKQGIIGEVELGFALIGDAGTEFLVDAESLSEGYLLSEGGLSSLGSGSPDDLPATDVGPGEAAGSEPAPGVAPPPEGGGAGENGVPESISVHDIDIITNTANGNLQIPDELLLYLAGDNQGAGLAMSGPAYDGVADNAYIWDAGLPAPGNPNTWADHGNDYVRFHIGNGNPTFEGSFGYEAANGQGATGYGTIGVANGATAKVGSYWTLTGSGADEVLLGLDGRNWIDGGIGEDIIHGGHDSSGDVLIGGAGDDVIFGGSGNDDLRGGDGDDTFLMSAGFGRDDVDGGNGWDTITLDGVLSQADVDDPPSWLSPEQGYVHDTVNNTITFDASAGGTIDLGGNNEISFQNIEQIVYTDVL